MLSYCLSSCLALLVAEFPRLARAGLEAKHLKSRHDKAGRRRQLWLCPRCRKDPEGASHEDLWGYDVTFPSGVVGSASSSDNAAINPRSSMAISPWTQRVDGTPGVLRTMRAGRQNDAEQMFGGTKILEQHRRREFMSKGSMTRLLGSLHHAAAISNGSMNLCPLPLTADGLANA